MCVVFLFLLPREIRQTIVNASVPVFVHHHPPPNNINFHNRDACQRHVNPTWTCFLPCMVCIGEGVRVYRHKMALKPRVNVCGNGLAPSSWYKQETRNKVYPTSSSSFRNAGMMCVSNANQPQTAYTLDAKAKILHDDA